MVDENGLDVISEASSCSLNLRDEYHHILGIDNTKVRPHIHMVTPFLYQLFKEGKTFTVETAQTQSRLSHCLSRR